MLEPGIYLQTGNEQGYKGNYIDFYSTKVKEDSLLPQL